MGRFNTALGKMFHYLSDPKLYAVSFVSVIVSAIVGLVPSYILLLLGTMMAASSPPLAIFLFILGMLWGVGGVFVMQLIPASMFARMTRNLSVVDSVKEGFSHIVDMGIAFILYFIIAVTPVLVSILIIWAGSVANIPTVSIVGIILAIIGVMWVIIPYVLLYPVLAVSYNERTRTSALKKSFEIVKTAILPTLGIIGIVVGITSAIGFILYMILYIILLIAAVSVMVSPLFGVIIMVLVMLIWYLVFYIIISAITFASMQALYETLTSKFNKRMSLGRASSPQVRSKVKTSNKKPSARKPSSKLRKVR